MSLRRGGTPLLGAGPPSLEASNQAQIDDLVQRNRTLEHMNQKLTAQITAEADRSKEAVLSIQTKWDENQRLWKEGCEDLLVSYRIVQKRLEVELEKERSAVIKEMAVAREEKLQRLQRDFKIKLFQMKEEETDRRIEDLEEGRSRMEEEYELVVQKMKEKCVDYAVKLKETQAALSRSEKEREEKEAKHNKLLEKHANLEGHTATSDSKLERTKLQLDGAQLRITETERTIDELKRDNADLSRQLERWQSLDIKEGAAAESQRKQRVALEAENRDLKATLENKDALLEKEERRVERMKTTTENWQTEWKAQEKAAQAAEKLVAKLEKQVQKLKSDLEIERARVRPPSPEKPQPAPPVDDDIIDVDAEQEEPPDKPSIKPPTATVKPGLSSQTKTRRSGIEGQVATKKTGGRPPPPQARKVASAPAPASNSDSEIEEISDPDPLNAVPEDSRAARKTRKGKAKAVEEDIEEAAPEPPTQKKGKRRVDVQEDTAGDGDEPHAAEQPKSKKRGSRAGSVLEQAGPATTNRVKSKPPSRAQSKQPTANPSTQLADQGEDNHEDDEAAAPKKKKRKLMSIFPDKSAGLPQFSAFGNGSLDIPSTLSPLKPDERVPQRSTSSNLVSSLGGLMKMPFGQPRR